MSLWDRAKGKVQDLRRRRFKSDRVGAEVDRVRAEAAPKGREAARRKLRAEIKAKEQEELLRELRDREGDGVDRAQALGIKRRLLNARRRARKAALDAAGDGGAFARAEEAAKAGAPVEADLDPGVGFATVEELARAGGDPNAPAADDDWAAGIEDMIVGGDQEGGAADDWAAGFEDLILGDGDDEDDWGFF